MTMTMLDPQRLAALFANRDASVLQKKLNHSSQIVAEVALWELGRQEHEANRKRLLSATFTNPVAGRDIAEGHVISEGGQPRMLVRAAYPMRGSDRVVLAVSYVSLATGLPEDRWSQHTLPANSERLHLVTRNLADIAPYAEPLPAVA